MSSSVDADPLNARIVGKSGRREFERNRLIEDVLRTNFMNLDCIDKQRAYGFELFAPQAIKWWQRKDGNDGVRWSS
jgi:hypothetical protein